MKVLQISPVYSAGGAERCARDLFLRLRDRGVQTEMWVAIRRPSDPPGVSCIRFPGERYLLPLDWALYHNDWRHVGSRWRLGRLTRRDVDIVHVHNVHGNWLSIRAIHDLCRRVPVVWTMHDEWGATGGIVYDFSSVLPQDEMRRLSRRSPRMLPYHATAGVRRLRRFLARWMPQPATIVCPSQYLQKLVMASGRFPGIPVLDIPNGLTLLEEPSTTMSRRAARERLGIPVEGGVVLLVAADLAAIYKGMDLGLETLQGVPAGERPTILLLGRNAEPLAARLRGFKVVSAFAADAAALAAAYRAADVTLVPSRGDNLPFVVLESFACRTPVAAFAVGGIVSMLAEGQRGLLAAPFDVAELRAQVVRLLRQPEMGAAMAERAYRWVAAECNMDTYLDRIMSVYQSLLGMNASGARPVGRFERGGA